MVLSEASKSTVYGVIRRSYPTFNHLYFGDGATVFRWKAEMAPVAEGHPVPFRRGASPASLLPSECGGMSQQFCRGVKHGPDPITSRKPTVKTRLFGPPLTTATTTMTAVVLQATTSVLT
jgi:hypothetical protein